MRAPRRPRKPTSLTGKDALRPGAHDPGQPDAADSVDAGAAQTGAQGRDGTGRDGAGGASRRARGSEKRGSENRESEARTARLRGQDVRQSAAPAGRSPLRSAGGKGASAGGEGAEAGSAAARLERARQRVLRDRRREGRDRAGDEKRSAASDVRRSAAGEARQQPPAGDARTTAAGDATQKARPAPKGEVSQSQVARRGHPGDDAALVVEEVGGAATFRERLRRQEPVDAPIEMSQRRAERQAERRRVRRRRVAVAAVCFVVVLALVWVAAFSPLLAFRSGRAKISGADGTLVKPAEVARVVDAYAGTPLLRLNTGSVETAIEKANPLVKEAKVSRSLPNGLNVKLAVREPVACLEEDGSCNAVDADGVRIDVPEEVSAGLPKLNLRGDNEEEATKSMVTVLAALDDSTRASIAHVAVSPTGQVSFSLDSGATVVWGRPVDNAKKAEVLASLLKQEATTYDVSAPNAPVTNATGGEGG